jgi:transcriptional regulator with XRE-family HTH domain
MDDRTPPWLSLPGARQAAADGRYGTLLRLARTAAGLTLDDAGRLVGYSAATLSRIETGRQPLTDVTVLRRLATAFAIPPALFGLVDGGDRAPVPAGAPLALVPAPAFAPVPSSVAVPAAFSPSPQASRPADTAWRLAGPPVPLPVEPQDGTGELLGEFERVLLDPPPPVGELATVASLRARVAAAVADYRACRYRQLARRLPRLLRAATTTWEHAEPERRAPVGPLLAEAYNLGTLLLIKLGADGMAWATADRAGQASRAVDHPLTRAETGRLAAIVCRHAGHRRQAQRMTMDAAARLSTATGLATATYAMAYGRLLATAAYTAALEDDRSAAWDLLAAADAAARGTGEPPAFAIADIALYKISVCRVLGDYGSALDYARAVNPERIATPVRRVRYWQDTALALHARGRYPDCLRALQAIELIAPQEILVRRWAQQLRQRLGDAA